MALRKSNYKSYFLKLNRMCNKLDKILKTRQQKLEIISQKLSQLTGIKYKKILPLSSS